MNDVKALLTEKKAALLRAQGEARTLNQMAQQLNARIEGNQQLLFRLQTGIETLEEVLGEVGNAPVDPAATAAPIEAAKPATKPRGAAKNAKVHEETGENAV